MILFVMRGVGRSPDNKKHVFMLHDAYRASVGLENLDWRNATDSYVCVLDGTKKPKQKQPKMLLSIEAYNVFSFPEELYLIDNPTGWILGQFMMRPSTILRGKVDEYSRKYLTNRQGKLEYFVIHVRALDGSCVTKLSKSHVSVNETTQISTDLTGKTVTAHDICNMEDVYVEAVFAEALRITGLKKLPPIYICHDNQRPQFVSRLVNKFGAIYNRERHAEGTLFDMLIMMRSTFLVGNPLSSFSTNMHKIRRAYLGEKVAAALTNLV